MVPIIHSFFALENKPPGIIILIYPVINFLETKTESLFNDSVFMSGICL